MSELSQQLAATLPGESAPGPGWVRELREAASVRFREHGLPTRRDEAWKYTSLHALEQRGVQLKPSSELAVPAAEQAQLLLDDAYTVRLLDGQVLNQDGRLPAGVTILPLAEALNQDLAGLRALLESMPGANDAATSADGFTTLNTALLEHGLVVHVAAGVDGGRLALNWLSGTHETPLFINSRVCLLLEEGARLDLFEQFENTARGQCSIVMQAELAPEARLSHVRFQQEADETVLVTRTRVAQHADSQYSHYGFDLGGGLVRHDLHTILQGGGARTSLNGAYLLDGDRHVDNQARVDHVAPGGSSEQYFRGVAGGNSKAVFNTAVCVHPGADETEAKQSNANILLSPLAEINTKPELEIYADEVIASHGATVGQLDEQAVFYLRSRGLSEHDARQLLTTAFCRSVSDRLPDQVLGELISKRMMEIMPKAG